MQTKLVPVNSWIERDSAEMVFRAITNVGIKPATFTHCNDFFFNKKVLFRVLKLES